jgi:hypothetical protein
MNARMHGQRHSFMQLYTTRKGATYLRDCSNCSTTHYSHEFAHDDHNERRDAIQAGTLCCEECGRAIGTSCNVYKYRMYAGRYSANGYLDCTDWSFNANIRKLRHQLVELYGEEQ